MGGRRIGQTAPHARNKNFVGEDFWYGILGRGISADGSVIYGTTWENWDFGMVYWKDWQNGGQAEYVGKDVHVRKVEKALDSQGLEYDYYCADGMICQANRTNISPSGKWIAGRTGRGPSPKTGWMR